MSLWESIPVAELCQIKPPKKEAKERLIDTDLVSFVPMSNLGICAKSLHLNEDKPLSDVSGSYTYFADNDVLLAKITPCFENGKLGIAKNLTNGIGFGSSEFIVFRSNGQLDPEYLFYYLSQDSFRGAGAKVMTGAVGHKRVPKEFIENLNIPLPPLPEQKRIVAILDEVFSGITQAVANAEKNLANARELFESYLNNVFTQKGDGWGESTINEVSTVINGYAFKSGDFSDQNTVKSIKITNVGVKEFVIDDSNLLPDDFCKLYDKVAIPEGSIVIALTRSIISSGFKVAVVPAEYDGALLNQRVAGLISKTDIVLSQYLYFYLCSTNVIEYVKKNVNTLMQPNLSITDLKSLPVPIPSLDNQIEIVENLRAMEREAKNLHDIYQKKLTVLAELKQSILQKAFTGELH